jgi:membrane protease subunit HflC
MKKHIGIIALAALVVGSLAMYTFAFQVDEQQDIVLVETFGEVTWTIIGRTDPGLKFKWPYPVQKVIRYDARGDVFEDTGDQVETRDKQNVIVTVFCAWRIADPALFHRAVSSDDPSEKVAIVEGRIRNIVRGAKSGVVGKHEMADFINTDPARMKLKEIEDDILARASVKVLEAYGVEIVHIGIKSLALPETVTAEVINANKAERQRDVSSYEHEGTAVATAIEQRALSDSKQIIAFAERKAKEIRSQGDQEAASIYSEYKDPEFANFLRAIEALKIELASRTIFVLDGSGLPWIRWFKDGPDIGPAKTTGTSNAGTE